MRYHEKSKEEDDKNLTNEKLEIQKKFQNDHEKAEFSKEFPEQTNSKIIHGFLGIH